MAWERYTEVSRHCKAFVAISQDGKRLCLNAGTCRQYGLHETTKADLWYDGETKRVGIKLHADGMLRAAYHKSCADIPFSGFCAQFGLSPTPGRYPVTEVDGMLVIQLGAA